MLGGRINQSRLEFLSPHVNSSQIMKQYGGKWRTKRRHNLLRMNRKMTSRNK
jgi:hypothetical protein